MKREIAPSLMIHPEDAAALDLVEGEMVEVSNARGAVEITVKLFDGVRRGVVIAEGIFPNGAHRRGEGINVLTGSDPVAPRGGAAFHDNAVAIRKL